MARTSNSVRRSQSAAYKRTPYQKTAYVNGTAVRHAEVGEGLERHLNQVSGRVPRRELEKQKQEMKRKIRNHLIQVLSASEIPQGILFLEALPKNESGKVRKRDLI